MSGLYFQKGFSQTRDAQNVRTVTKIATVLK